MKIKLSHISPGQAFLVCALSCFFMSLILIILNIVVAVAQGDFSSDRFSGLIIGPLVGLGSGGITGLLGAAVYNLVAKITGGLECEFDECDAETELNPDSTR